MDLYSKQIGSNFSDIDSFSAYIGGSPTHISVCSQRLGLNTALLSAVGDDLTGKFIMDKLIKENVMKHSTIDLRMHFLHRFTIL